MSRYHYTQSGLDNVWLENGFRVLESPYGRGVAIDDVPGLHRVIGAALVEKAQKLSGKEFRFLRVEMELSQAKLGELLGKTAQSVALWEKSGKVPPAVDFLIRHIYRQNVLCSRETYVETVEALLHKDRRQLRDKLAFQATGEMWRTAS